ncbi:hypothetical protein GGQ97_002314 [Sphingomonas kaistensis]|uniref:Uncharacterized protein n=1 Tax=Sphingomonas kaistensis TaxID=298708 RepID=A0A7X5YAE5_9SPHN|nr:hypothetical protein [Sphingomonas kaistensis]NJC06521.1 hypothetical protein [Sphingomonas kaistensis]
MTLPASSETLGTGGVIATSTVGGKEYQVVMSAGADGHIVGSRPDFFLSFAAAANAANRILGDVYNTGTVPIRIRGLWLAPTMTAITGASIDWIVGRTTAVGTGGTSVTPAPLDTSGGSWPAAATARANPTGGATAGTALFPFFTLNEETNAAFGMVPLVNLMPQLGDRVIEVVLRQNEGLAVRQSATANAVGLTGMLMLATFDN